MFKRDRLRRCFALLLAFVIGSSVVITSPITLQAHNVTDGNGRFLLQGINVFHDVGERGDLWIRRSPALQSGANLDSRHFDVNDNVSLTTATVSVENSIHSMVENTERRLSVGGEAGFRGAIVRASASYRYSSLNANEFRESREALFFQSEIMHRSSRATLHFNNPETQNAVHQQLHPNFLDDVIWRMEPEQIFQVYGTHFISQYHLGGRFEKTQVVASLNQEISSEVRTAHEAAASVSGAGATARVTMEMENNRASWSQNGYRSHHVQGVPHGGAPLVLTTDDSINHQRINEWAQTIPANPIVLIDEGLELVPIWELIPRNADFQGSSFETRRNELEQAFISLALEQERNFLGQFSFRGSFSNQGIVGVGYREEALRNNLPVSGSSTTGEGQLPSDVNLIRSVSTRQQLVNALSGDNATAGRHVIIQNDIDMSATPWTPINNFQGTLDGGGHTLIGLHTSSPSSRLSLVNAGLFGLLSRGTVNIRDLTIQIRGGAYPTVSNYNINLTHGIMVQRTNNESAARAGALIGRVEGSGTNVNIERVSVEGGAVVAHRTRSHAGSISVNANAGGLIGQVHHGTVSINSSHVNTEVISLGRTHGSLVNRNSEASAGGFIGRIDGGWVTIRNSHVENTEIYARARGASTDNARPRAGGFVGWRDGGTLTIINSLTDNPIAPRAVRQGGNTGTALSGQLVGNGSFTNRDNYQASELSPPVSSLPNWCFDTMWRTGANGLPELRMIRTDAGFVIHFPQGRPSFEAGTVLPRNLSEIMEIMHTDGGTWQNVTNAVVPRFDFSRPGYASVQFLYGNHSFTTSFNVTPWMRTNVRLSRVEADPETVGTSVFVATRNSSSIGVSPLVAPYREGFVFDGYWTSVAGGERVVNANMTLAPNVNGFTNANGQWVFDEAGSVTLYAQWEPDTIMMEIEVAQITSLAGRVVEVPIMISGNTGISAISDLRIELGDGLSLYFPLGQHAYGANPATWPFSARVGAGFSYGMIPMAGRPQDANIGTQHVQFIFGDMLTPFDSYEDGILLTLFVYVDGNAEGGTEIPIFMTVHGSANVAGRRVLTNANSGGINVVDGLVGDINDDGLVDIFDVQGMGLWLNRGRPVGVINEGAARIVDDEGQPTIFDLQALLLWINRGGNPREGFSRPPVDELIEPLFTPFADADLIIEVDNQTAQPGDIIEVPILITSNPGVSAISALRIDLDDGLSLHFPQGQEGYAANPNTWPFVARTAPAWGDGMIPVAGRPEAANIGSYHIVLNFIDIIEPFDSTEIGELLRLRLRVADTATGNLNITLSGGYFDNVSEQGARPSILQSGFVITPGENIYPVTVHPAVANYVVVNPITASAGETITAAITPPLGQRLTEDGISATGVSNFTGNIVGSTEVTFTKTAGATEVNATFENIPDPIYAVNISGTAVTQTAISPLSPVTVGQTVNVIVTAPVGQRFTTAANGTIAIIATGAAGFDLIVSADRLTATGSFTMPANIVGLTVDATFENIPDPTYAVNIGGTAAPQTAISPLSPVTVGQTVDVIVTAPVGQRFTTVAGGTIAIATTGVAGFDLIVSADRLTATGSFTMPASMVGLTIDTTFENTPGPTNAQPPNISIQPQNISVYPNQPAILSVAATSADGGILSFQWQRALGASGGIFTNIAGATSETLNADTASIGVNRYQVIITNTIADGVDVGTTTANVTSSVVTVTVSPQTFALTVSAETGGTVTGTASGNFVEGTPISVNAVPNANYHFVNWTIAGAIITGGNTANPATFNMPVGAVTLTANFAPDINAGQPNITGQPQSQTLFVGDAPINLTVTATSPDGGTLSFQWQSAPGASGGSFTNIVGATSTSFTPNTASAGITRYQVVVTNTIADVSGVVNATATVTSAVATVTVNVPTWNISLSPSVNHNFGRMELGGTPPSAHTVTVTNTGNQPTGALTVALTGANAGSFTLGGSTSPNLTIVAPGNTAAFTVVPTATTLGTYTATVTVTGGNSISAQFNVNFEVYANPPTITSANNVIAHYGASSTFTVTATGTPSINFSLEGSVPDGVSINSTTGVMTIPNTLALGSHSFTTRATGAIAPDATQNFMITVAVPHSITIYDGGVGASANPNPAAQGETVALNPGTAPTGYVFERWTTSPAALSVAINNPTSATTANFQMINEAVNLVANWIEAILTFDLTVAGTGTGGTPSGTTTHAPNAVVSIEAGTRTGYIFTGWTVSPLEMGTFANANATTTTFTMPSQNVTIAANWTADTGATVTSVNVTPATGIIRRGQTRQYSATVLGIDSPSQAVTWSVEGNVATGTTISSTGLLSIASNQAAGILTIRATSIFNTAISGTATVTVQIPTGDGGGGNGGDANGNGAENDGDSEIGTSVSTPTPAISGGANRGSISVPIRMSSDRTVATLELPSGRVTGLINTATDYTVTFYLHEVPSLADVTTVTLPRNAIRQFAEASLSVRFYMPIGTINFDAYALRGLGQQARANNISVLIESREINDLSEIQQDALMFDYDKFGIRVRSGHQFITEFEGLISTSVPFAGNQPSVWRLSNDGTRSILVSRFDNESQFVTFDTDRLSTFIVAEYLPSDSPPGAAIEEEILPPPPITSQAPCHILRFVIGREEYYHRGIVHEIEAAPFISDERTMIPLRVITEALEAFVYWDEDTRTVTISRNGVTMSLAIGQPLPDGMGTPLIVNERTFVPARYVSEMLGATVRWDGDNRAVYIYQQS